MFKAFFKQGFKILFVIIDTIVSQIVPIDKHSKGLAKYIPSDSFFKDKATEDYGSKRFRDGP